MAFGEIAPKFRPFSSYIRNVGVAEEPVYHNGPSGTVFTIALDNGNLQDISITGNVTVSFTNPKNPGKFTILIKQDATGHTFATSGVLYPSGTAPTWSSTANKIDLLSIVYDGTNLYGMGGVAFS